MGAKQNRSAAKGATKGTAPTRRANSAKQPYAKARGAAASRRNGARGAYAARIAKQPHTNAAIASNANFAKQPHAKAAATTLTASDGGARGFAAGDESARRASDHRSEGTTRGARTNANTESAKQPYATAAATPPHANFAKQPHAKAADATPAQIASTPAAVAVNMTGRRWAHLSDEAYAAADPRQRQVILGVRRIVRKDLTPVEAALLCDEDLRALGLIR